MATHDPRIDWQLEQAIGEVARRCRRRRLIQCGFRFGSATLLLVLAFTGLLAILPPYGSPRFLALAAFAVAELLAAWRLLMRPLRAPIPFQQAALLIDERHPELENRIVTAAEFSGKSWEERSVWLVARLLEDSWRATENIPLRELLDPKRAVRWTVLGVAVWLGVFACIGLWRNLWVPDLPVLRTVGMLPPASRFGFTVEPGSIRVRQGDSATVRVLSEQTAAAASIYWREAGGAWRTASMEQGLSAKIHFHHFADLQSEVFYRVRVGAAESEVYHIAVWTPPEVQSLDLTYHFPDYLKLPPAETPHGGDITAVVGTKVDVAVHVNKPLASAQLALSSATLALRQTQPNRWEGTLEVTQNDVYRVELTDAENARNDYVPEYRITAQQDKAPDVKIAFPRGDLDVTSLDEIPFEFQVDDDFGLGAYGIQFEVAGRDPVRVPLRAADSAATRTAEGRHTLLLENLNLTAGDLVTWAVWAEDGMPHRAPFETLGDPFFFEIRPFRRTFEEAVSDQSSQERRQRDQQRQQGPGGAAANQKEVLIATWNLRREAKNLKPAEFDERLTKIKDAQRRVKQQIEERGLEGARDGSLLPKTLEAIEKALAALEQTESRDPSARLGEAIRHMQVAHGLLLKARPERSQVQMARNASGQQNPMNQREIQEMELRRNRNFYEQERRVQEQREATEQSLNDLRDLARRQRMINEEMSKLISEMKQEGSKRPEELARQLERLREEERRTLRQLDQTERNVATGRMDNRQARDTSRALGEARRQMTRGLENMERNQFQQARAAGSRAEQSLGEAEQALQRLSRDAAAERMTDLQRQMQAIGRRQDGIRKEVEDLKQRYESPGSLRQDENLDRRRRDVIGEEDELAKEFRGLLDEAANLAKGAETSQELMARRLGDWLRQTSREEIPENIQEARRLVDYGIWEPAAEAEQEIGDKLARAEKNLAGVAEGAVRNDLDGMRRALDELRRLRDGEDQLRRTAQARQGDGQTSATAEARSGERGRSGQPKAGQKGASEKSKQVASGKQAGEGQRGSGQPGDQPKAGPRGGQRGDQPGQGGERGQQASAGERSSAQQDQAAGNRDGRGGWGDWIAPRTAEQMRRFLERDYRDWTDRIREAEALLPDDNETRRRLGAVREALAGLRRNFRGLTSRAEDEKPHFDLLKETVGIPLSLAAEDLERQIRKREDAEKLTLTDEDAVPEKYRKRVSAYYEALSESDKK